MSYLAAERMKLLSTRSPWWCAGITVVIFLIPVVFVAVLAEAAPTRPLATFLDIVTGTGQIGVVMILLIGALAVTTEYRFSTMRVTFLAVPKRAVALGAKAVVLALAAAVIGLVCTLLTWGLSALLSPGADMMVGTAQQWRALLAVPILFAVTAVLAVAIGVLVRHTAAAIMILLGWVLVVENLVTLIPNVGPEIHPWLPFASAFRFASAQPQLWDVVTVALSPWGSVGWFAAVAVGVLAIAMAVTSLRDA